MALDTTTLRSRRALLAGAFGGLVAIAAQAVGRPISADAANGDVVRLGEEHQATAPTRFFNTAQGVALTADTGSGPAFAAETGSGDGVRGTSYSGAGVRGRSTEAYGVYGASSTYYGVYGESASNYGVVGFSGGRTAVAGISDSGQGVLGQGGSGRGGRFSGRKAQVRLEPSGAASHPASGAAGDLFVDRSRRLWFCKGGRSWVRHA